MATEKIDFPFAPVVNDGELSRRHRRRVRERKQAFKYSPVSDLSFPLSIIRREKSLGRLAASYPLHISSDTDNAHLLNGPVGRV